MSVEKKTQEGKARKPKRSFEINCLLRNIFE